MSGGDHSGGTLSGILSVGPLPPAVGPTTPSGTLIADTPRHLVLGYNYKTTEPLPISITDTLSLSSLHLYLYLSKSIHTEN